MAVCIRPALHLLMTDSLTEDKPLPTERAVVFSLALPVLTEQMLSYFVSLVDTYLSGQLGPIATTATSAVGLAGYVSWLGTLLFGLVGIGTTAIVARAWGGGRRRAAGRIANQSIVLSFILGILFLAFMLPSAPLFATLLQMDGDAREIIIRYLRIDAVGLVFTSVTLAISAALRGIGDMRTPMFVLGFVNVVNAVASWILVHGWGVIPAQGVDGIVYGTLIARCCGGILLLLALQWTSRALQLHSRWLWPRRRPTQRILRVGIPAAADGLMVWIGHFLFLMIISSLGEGEAGRAIFAAHILGIRVEAITYLPAVAWGHAAATLVGQNLGAHRPARARNCGHEAARQCLVIGLVMTVVLYFAANIIYESLHDDPAVWKAGVPALKLMAFFQVPVVLSIVYIQSLRGAGDTIGPLIISTLGILLVRLPLAYLCGVVLDGGLMGAWVGMCGDQFVRSSLAFLRFARGSWMHAKV